MIDYDHIHPHDLSHYNVHFFSIETCHRIRALEVDAIVAAGHAGPIPLGNKVPAEFTPAGLKSAMATGDFCDWRFFL